ncbi:MAG TPA: hypothetical protein PKJ56_11960, partial [Promineifilum sp.]|nr:hypothetical protein [Promineifilum sp.]
MHVVEVVGQHPFDGHRPGHGQPRAGREGGFIEQRFLLRVALVLRPFFLRSRRRWRPGQIGQARADQAVTVAQMVVEEAQR